MASTSMPTVHPSRSANIPIELQQQQPAEKQLPAKRVKKKHARPPAPSSTDPASLTSSSIGTLRNSIRNLERLFQRAASTAHTLPADVRVEKERALAHYRHDLAEALAERRTKEMVGKYHMVRFFDRQKATRVLRKARAAMKDAESTAGGANEGVIVDDGQIMMAEGEGRKEVERRRAAVSLAEVDLNYALYCPLGEKYVSLFPNEHKAAEERRKRKRETEDEDGVGGGVGTEEKEKSEEVGDGDVEKGEEENGTQIQDRSHIQQGNAEEDVEMKDQGSLHDEPKAHDDVVTEGEAPPPSPPPTNTMLTTTTTTTTATTTTATKPPLWSLIQQATLEGKLKDVREGKHAGLEALYGRREDRLEEWAQEEAERKRKRSKQLEKQKQKQKQTRRQEEDEEQKTDEVSAPASQSLTIEKDPASEGLVDEGRDSTITTGPTAYDTRNNHTSNNNNNNNNNDKRTRPETTQQQPPLNRRERRKRERDGREVRASQAFHQQHQHQHAASSAAAASQTKTTKKNDKGENKDKEKTQAATRSHNNNNNNAGDAKINAGLDVDVATEIGAGGAEDGEGDRDGEISDGGFFE